jgi:PEP-CTERM motif
MRKLFRILAILGLAVGVSALSARADSVTYKVTSTYASDVPTTTVSAPGVTFTLVFTVPLTITGDFSPTGTNGFVDLPPPPVDVTFSAPGLTGFTAPATIFFNPVSGGGGGLFSLTFPGNDFDWEFMGPQMFSLNSTETVATFLPGPFTVMGGTGFPSPTGSFFFDTATLAGGDLTGGSVGTVVPEPSSLLLLGSGFLALGGFARKRLIARFN